MAIETIAFEKQKDEILYKQIEQKIIQEIRNGSLVKGERLPSIRNASRLLDVSKTTVENAYELLMEEGYITSFHGKGYYVDVDDKAIALRDTILKQEETEPTYRYYLTSDTIDPESFDFERWKHYLKAVMKDEASLSRYGDAQGELALRKALSQYVYKHRGVVTDSSHIVVGASYQSLLYVLCALLEEKSIAMETGVFAQANQVFQDMGYSVYWIEREKENFDLDALSNLEASLLYLHTVSCGKNYRSLDKDARNGLLAWVQQDKHYILEDDHNGELRYASKVMPALKGYDHEDKVVYMSSFSKVLLPSLRIAYMALPDALYEKYKQRKSNYNPTASKMEQLALANYIADGNLDKHIRKVQRRYEQKSKAMFRLLKQYFLEDTIVLEESSFQYVVKFKQPLHPQQIQKIHDQKIKIDITEDRMKISFSMIDEEEMNQVLAILLHCIHEREI